jgi:hypothetical protein
MKTDVAAASTILSRPPAQTVVPTPPAKPVKSKKPLLVGVVAVAVAAGAFYFAPWKKSAPSDSAKESGQIRPNPTKSD